jgi:hypothetical protein
MEEVRKTTKNCQDNRSPAWDLKPRSPEYEAGHDARFKRVLHVGRDTDRKDMRKNAVAL